MQVFGIDVSFYQKGIDFAKAKKEGVKYAIIKATEGNFVDPCFEDNYKRAKEAGLEVGAYHYLRALTPSDVKVHAKTLVSKLKGKQFGYPIFVDVEDGAVKKLTKAQVTELVTTFCTTLESAGYWAGFYTNLDWYRNHLDGSSLAKRFSFWAAYWGKSCPFDDAQMWQFGGSVNLLKTNIVAGVICDQDYSFKDFPSLIKAKGLNGFTATPAPKPAPKPTPAPALEEGDKIRILKGATIYGSTKAFASWVYSTTYIVSGISDKGKRIAFSSLDGIVVGATDVKFVKKV